MKKLIGKLTLPKEAFWDGYEYKIYDRMFSGRNDSRGVFYHFGWLCLKQNWLGWWVVDDMCRFYSTDDLRKYAVKR